MIGAIAWVNLCADVALFAVEPCCALLFDFGLPTATVTSIGCPHSL